MFSSKNTCKLDILTSVPIAMTIPARHILYASGKRNCQTTEFI